MGNRRGRDGWDGNGDGQFESPQHRRTGVQYRPSHGKAAVIKPAICRVFAINGVFSWRGAGGDRVPTMRGSLERISGHDQYQVLTRK